MRFSTYLIGIPVAVAAAVVAVANREVVLFSLDPFSADAPVFATRMPLFLLLFAVFGVGLLVGWIAAVWTRPAPPPPVKTIGKTGRSLLPWRGRGTKPPKA